MYAQQVEDKMFLTVKNLTNLTNSLEVCSGTTCLFFVVKDSNPSNALEPILVSECEKASIPIIKIFVDNPCFFNLITKYKVGPIPGYVFVRGGKVLFSSYGLVSRQTIIEAIKKVGGN